MSSDSNRRGFLARLGLLFTSVISAPFIAISNNFKGEESNQLSNQVSGKMKVIKNISPLGFQWETADPFLFCVHHEDAFPKGNEKMGPANEYFKGRHLGDDFIIKDGFRMYHGKTVPGFPGHPHRGFETITVVRKGMVDHADSMGAAGRYGDGDVQWMTAGKGVQHSEMFPLVKQDEANPLELFQIWLNLPKANKLVEPHFKMLWRESIPNEKYTDDKGKLTTVEVIAGKLKHYEAKNIPPDSWAADPKNEVGVYNVKMQANAIYVLPKASKGVNRRLYFYEGTSMQINEQIISKYSSIAVEESVDLILKAGNEEVSILVLQGKPIDEPVIQYGPFVMNTKEEINEAFEDYHKTGFGGWPWPKYDQVHDRNKPRFAKHADGREEFKG